MIERRAVPSVPRRRSFHGSLSRSLRSRGSSAPSVARAANGGWGGSSAALVLGGSAAAFDKASCLLVIYVVPLLCVPYGVYCGRILAWLRAATMVVGRAGAYPSVKLCPECGLWSECLCNLLPRRLLTGPLHLGASTTSFAPSLRCPNDTVSLRKECIGAIQHTAGLREDLREAWARAALGPSILGHLPCGGMELTLCLGRLHEVVDLMDPVVAYTIL